MLAKFGKCLRNLCVLLFVHSRGGIHIRAISLVFYHQAKEKWWCPCLSKQAKSTRRAFWQQCQIGYLGFLWLCLLYCLSGFDFLETAVETQLVGAKNRKNQGGHCLYGFTRAFVLSLLQSIRQSARYSVMYKYECLMLSDKSIKS